MCTNLSLTKRKARKQHKCIWCGEFVEKGEHYIDHRGVFENSITTQAWHLECEQGYHEYSRAEGGGCVYFSAYDNERPKRIK